MSMLSKEQWRITVKNSRPNLIGLVLITIGLVVGLLWAYAIAPVVWTNAEPVHLDPSYQDEWIKMVAQQYVETGDRENASRQLLAVGNAVSIIDRLRALNLNDSALVGRLDELRPIAVAVGANEGNPSLDKLQPGTLQGLNPVLCAGGFLVVGAVLVILWGMYGLMIRAVLGALNPFKRRREPVQAASVGEAERARRGALEAAQQMMAAQQAEVAAGRAAAPVVAPGMPAGPPLRQFVSVYAGGDDYYDDTFSIEDNSGAFLGECGAGISETVGVGSPKKVTAIEAWLFDKNDIKTVTKVIMSEYAYHNEALRNDLESRGELVLAQPGNRVLLETATMQVVVTIVDLEYGAGGPAPNSFYERLTINLAAHPKAGAVGGPLEAGTTDYYGGTVPLQ